MNQSNAATNAAAKGIQESDLIVHKESFYRELDFIRFALVKAFKNVIAQVNVKEIVRAKRLACFVIQNVIKIKIIHVVQMFKKNKFSSFLYEFFTNFLRIFYEFFTNLGNF